MNSKEIRSWTSKFIDDHGRAPRVLHIGNIANNAWQNAKLMNKVEGTTSTVFCPDAYHCMGVPEWEEAEFDASEIEDQFYPQWWKVNLNGYVRPKFFIQGPRAACLAYLTGHGQRKVSWEELRKLAGVQRVRWWEKLLIRARLGNVQRIPYYIVSAIVIAIPAMVLFLKGGRKAVTIKQVSDVRKTIWNGVFSNERIRKIWDRLRVKGMEDVERLEHLTELVGDFKKRFPDRDDQLTLDDFRGYPVGRSWELLFEQFDIIQGYSTAPINPMIADVSYFAFEHGTLRDIPFEDSPRGRLTSLAYARAEHVFVTNFDCLDNAHMLAGDPSRVTLINHPFDENDLPDTAECSDLRRQLREELDSDFLIFFPTRHDWVEGKGYNDKANDRLLEAVGKLRGNDESIGLILCDWGHNQAESRSLIDQLSYANHVKWVSPQATRRFMKMCCACDVVADQFQLGSFGGILFKAMATGTPILTYLDEQEMLKMYPSVPPVLNAKTVTEIVDLLTEAVSNSKLLDKIGLGGRQWIKEYHSGGETTSNQMIQYEKYLKRIGKIDPI